MSVRMEHPDLPDQSIDVDELAVASHRAAGWESAPAADKPAKTPPATIPADTGSTASEAAPRPARRAQKEGDEK